MCVVCLGLPAFGQPDHTAVQTLDSCRTMALESNKQLMIRRAQMAQADYKQRQAFSAYLPAIDFAGGYLYNEKNMSVLGEDKFLPILTDGVYDPSMVAWLPKDELSFNTHNIFFGAITLTQPIYMGGKIAAMNYISRDAQLLAEQMHNNEVENVIYAVDGAYWQVVSMKAKCRLARGYVELLDTLSHDIHIMYKEGMATYSDVLSVDVKLNSAQVDLTKAENGLVLSRMVLAQVCGLPVNTVLTLADEDVDEPSLTDQGVQGVDMGEVYTRRPDLEALRLNVSIAGYKKRIERAKMLPSLALTGSYMFTNPNLQNGFSRSFKGSFSVGATLSIPLWHWGGNYYGYRAAAAEETVAQLQLDDAYTQVDLQVQQALFRTTEAYRTYNTTCSNLNLADENLRIATLSFREGMATTDNVLEAQTAWLRAHSEKIDALIDVELCNTYLSKCLGTLY